MSKSGGGSASPLSKSGGAVAPPAPPSPTPLTHSRSVPIMLSATNYDYAGIVGNPYPSGLKLGICMSGVVSFPDPAFFESGSGTFRANSCIELLTQPFRFLAHQSELLHVTRSQGNLLSCHTKSHATILASCFGLQAAVQNS